MAERLPHDLEPSPRGMPPKYPWDEWLDGSTWRIKQGEDFDVDPRSMQVSLHNAARRRAGRMITKRVDEITVDFQFQK